jgi:hypothetical protein
MKQQVVKQNKNTKITARSKILAGASILRLNNKQHKPHTHSNKNNKNMFLICVEEKYNNKKVVGVTKTIENF